MWSLSWFDLNDLDQTDHYLVPNQAFTYSSLIRKTLGKKMASLLATLLVVYMWGACNAYLIIMGDVFSLLGRAAAGPDSYFADRCLCNGVSPLAVHLSLSMLCMASPAWHPLHGILCMTSPACHPLHGMDVSSWSFMT